jgi:hypothetical protein
VISESVEVPRPLKEAYSRWVRDETIPAAMRGAERAPAGEADDAPDIVWSDDNDAPGHGRLHFEAVGEGRTRISIELEPEPEAEGGADAAPRARGLLARFRDSFPATDGDPTTPLGGMSADAGTEQAPTRDGNEAPPEETEDVDLTKNRHVPGFPSNR